MTDSIPSAIVRLLDGEDLSAEQMHAAILAIMDGKAGEVEIAALLTALRMKGEAVSEIVGAARAMHERAESIPVAPDGLLDTCGTGGDALSTFNISTAAALVAAAAGVRVAKHGNRSVSSSSGSADVLEALGVNIQLTPERVARCIEELGIGFCFAPLMHGAMKHAAPVRKQLGIRTIFNVLGPLTNPACAEYQLVGVTSINAAEKLALALAQFGRKQAFVVCGNAELDEVSLWGETDVLIVRGSHVESDRWTAESFGLPQCQVEEIQVDSAEASAAVIRGVLATEKGSARNMVLANAAAALLAAERCADLPSAVAMAADAVDSGRAAELCRRLVKFSNA